MVWCSFGAREGAVRYPSFVCVVKRSRRLDRWQHKRSLLVSLTLYRMQQVQVREGLSCYWLLEGAVPFLLGGLFGMLLAWAYVSASTHTVFGSKRAAVQ